MTVTSTNQKVSFSGNGSTTVFAYNFKIFAQTDLLVILRSATGTETTQNLTSNYTVSGVGATSGGNVTMGVAPPSGTTLVIQRVQPQLQGLDLVPNDPFPAQSMEDALDKLVFNVQSLNEEVGRAIKASTTNTIGSTEFTTSATDRANKLFSFDGSGDLQISQELGTYRGNWAASTAYFVRDLVKDTSTGNIFIVITAHTSSGSQPITTNTDAAKWALIVDAASATTSATAAASSATAAASSATASASSASSSSTKADEAAASASTASTKAGEAATSATAAASSATAAASSATAAATSATSAAASATDVAKVQGITNGTVSASKAMVVDANKDISGGRNLTITGELDAATLDISGALTANGGVVFNESSADVDFRVESNGNANMLFVDGGNDAVGIGTGSPASLIHGMSGDAFLTANSTSADSGQGLYFQSTTSGWATSAAHAAIFGKRTDASNGYLKFDTRGSGNSAERMRIDSSGNLLVGTTDTTLYNNSTGTGTKIGGDGRLDVSRSADTVATFNRTGSSDGEIIRIVSSGTTVGSIKTFNSTVQFGGAAAAIYLDTAAFLPANANGRTDNTIDLGSGSHRYDDVFATNGTIQTSDRNEKQDIASLTPTEMLVAARLSTGFKNFKWKDAVAEKGAAARTHSGVIAQDVQDAFTAEGLDAGDYAMFISGTWWSHDVDVPAVDAVEAVDATYDDDGNELTAAVEAVEAADAYTRTDTYDTEDEAPEGATSKTRMGIRYPELLSFVAAYNEQRFAAIETRLAALEAV